MTSFLLALTLLFFQAATVPDAATVEGFVLKLGVSDPVARARVVLTRDGGPPASVTATTDGGGKFTFKDVPPGKYRIIVTRDGYVRGEYGQRAPGLAGTAVSLAAKQEMKDIRIQLTPTGAIAGRVYDRFGDAVGNATVQALKYSYQEGRRVLTVAQSSRTNDLGEYRLYWMQPGQYIISAVPNENRLDGNMMMLDLGPNLPMPVSGAMTGAVRVAGNLAAGGMSGMMPPADTGETYLTVYYPGTTDAAGAAPVDLRPGANYTGVDLTVVDTRAVRVRGRVVSSRPGPVRASVSLVPRGSLAGNAQLQRVAQVTDQGTFEFRGIAPGAYDLIANSGGQVFTFSDSASGAGRTAFVMTAPAIGPAGERGFAGNANEPRLFGRTALDVGNADVEGVTIQLQQGFTLSGRITIEGPAAGGEMPLANMRVTLRPEPMIAQLGSLPAQVTANGTFTVTDLMPGDYRLSVIAVPRGGYVKSAVLAGTDASNLLLHVDGEPRGALEIVVGTNPGSLAAAVQNEKQEAVTGATVVLIPNGARRGRSELYRTATSDASGRVHFDAVVPGDYKLFAWEIVESGAWQDPDFMRIHEERGRTVHINEGGREVSDVRVIR